MTNITHRLDPAGITKPNRYTVDKNTNVLDWLNTTFQDQDNLCGNLACSIYLNGKEIFRCDHENVDESLLDFTLGDNDHLLIVNRPAYVAAVVQIVIAVISVAVAVYSYMNMPKLPGAEEAGNESPNNRLNAASNQFRPGQGIPECFGSGISYPDFIQPSYYFYENNVKKVVGLFCSTAGVIGVDEVRVGDTDITAIPESSAVIYPPFTTVPSEFLTIHQAATNVDGQVLVASDDDSVVFIDINVDMVEVGAFVSLTITTDQLKSLSLEVGLYVYIRNDDINGVFEILNLITGAGVTQIFFSGSYAGPLNAVATVGRGSPDGVIGSGLNGELDTWIGWFDTPGEQAEEVFVHWQAPLGVRDEGGGLITLSIRIEIENIDNNQKFIKDASIQQNTFDPQFVTSVFNRSEFPGMTVGQYKVRAKRLTNTVSANGGASEQLKVEGYVSVTPYSAPNFGDTTTVLVQRRATLFSPDQAGQKINLDYNRSLPRYNRGSGEYETDNLQPSKGFADAVAYTLIVKGGESESTVNLAELYAIQDGLSDQQLGEFTFTFDDANLSKGERVESICNVARVSSFHDGSQWRFARDEAKPIRSAMFNRRSVTGNNARQGWQPQRDDDADSVRIIYVDDDTNTEAYIDRSFNTQTGQIISGEIGAIPIEIKLAGCRNAYQASNRADLEIRRVAYQRRSVKETTYRDALELELLDRVGWVDINDIDTFDGEIMGISGNTYDTTERFTPEAGKVYVVFLTDNEGYPSNTVPCEARSDTEFGFVASGISGAYVASGNQQVGSRYFIADANDLESSEFTLKARSPNPDGTVEVELVEYNSKMYEQDAALPPSEAPILPNELVATDVVQSTFDSTSSFTLESDGTISLNNDTALWYGGGTTSGIGSSFEVYATVVSGSLNSGIVGAWVNMSSGVEWTTFKTGGNGVQECVLNLNIRETEYPENSVTNNITIRSVVAAPVSLPASITIDPSVGIGQARIDFLSNGEWRGSDGDSGSYTTTVDFVGDYYELRATNVAGDLDLGVVGSWIQLSGAGAVFALTANSTETVTFDAEIREVADIANSSTCAVTLKVTF